MQAARTSALVLLIAAIAPPISAAESPRGEAVAVRIAAGQFLRLADDGSLRADRACPAEQELFELFPRENGSVELRASSGRCLTAAACATDAAANSAAPGPVQAFTLAGLPPAQQVEIYRAYPVPSPIRQMLGELLRDLIVEEFAEKEYNKTRTRKSESYYDLPAPTLRDLRRTKRRRVMSVTEEYQVQAKLDGKPEFAIRQMPYLKGYLDSGAAKLMFAVDAKLPVVGHVRYKIPDVLSASTGFRTEIRLSLIGELRAKKSGDELTLDSPELSAIQVQLDKLALSNDILQTLHRPIERLVNHELRDNEDRLREKANAALAKAFHSRRLEHPLLRFLSLP